MAISIPIKNVNDIVPWFTRGLKYCYIVHKRKLQDWAKALGTYLSILQAK